MLVSNIDVFVCVVISQLAQVFIVSSNRVAYEFFFLWLSFCDMNLPSKSNVPSL